MAGQPTFATRWKSETKSSLPQNKAIPSDQESSTSSSTTIVEPPVRTRPFRSFRSTKPITTGTGKRRPIAAPRRVIVKNSSTESQVTGTYPVQAIHFAQSIDLAAAVSKVFAMKGIRRMMERLSVVVQLPPTSENTGDRFIAVFRFGSIVCFNVSPKDTSQILENVKRCAKDVVLGGNEIKEKFCIHVQPDVSDDEDIVTGEYCIVQQLNMKSVDVISNILAQSVALDSYNDMVDDLLANFETINGKVTRNGNLSEIDREKMFQAVARNNSIFIDMISKVGMKDRIDTAWNLSQYEDIHDGMKDEFDIDQRFHHIEFKLNVIQENAKFFLDVLAHQKSNSLEWIIIVLIFFECVLMCMEMSGTGEAFFKYLGIQIPS